MDEVHAHSVHLPWPLGREDKGGSPRRHTDRMSEQLLSPHPHPRGSWGHAGTWQQFLLGKDLLLKASP